MGKFRFGDTIMETPVKMRLSDSNPEKTLVPIIEYVEKIVEVPIEKIIEKPVYLTSYVEREVLMKDRKLRLLTLGNRRDMRRMKKELADKLMDISKKIDDMPMPQERIIEVHKVQDTNYVTDKKLLALVIVSIVMNMFILMTSK